MFDIFSTWGWNNTLGVCLTGAIALLFSFQLSFEKNHESFFQTRFHRFAFWFTGTLMTYGFAFWTIEYQVSPNSQVMAREHFTLTNYPFFRMEPGQHDVVLDSIFAIKLQVPAMIVLLYLSMIWLYERRKAEYTLSVREAFILTYLSILVVDWMHMHTFYITREVHTVMGIGGAGLADGLVVVPLVAFMFLGAIKFAKGYEKSQFDIRDFLVFKGL
jgi:hypothetical protein